MLDTKEQRRIYRHQRIRKDVSGGPDQLRLCVHRSSKNIYAQLIDDRQGKVLLGLSSLNKEIRSKIKKGGNIEAASVVGEMLARKAQAKGIQKVCFDRGGYLYHGRIKAFAEAARKGGLEF